VSPGRPLEDQNMDSLLVLAQTHSMYARSSNSKMPAQQTLATKGNCCFKCGKLGHFAKECFSNKFPPRKNEGTDQHSKPQETGKSSSMCAEGAQRNTHCQENL